MMGDPRERVRSRLPPSIEIAVAVVIAAAASSFAGCGGDSNAPGTPADTAGGSDSTGAGRDGGDDASAPTAGMGGTSAAAGAGAGGAAGSERAGAGSSTAGGVAEDAGSAGDSAVESLPDYVCPAPSELAIGVLAAVWQNGQIAISLQPTDPEAAMHLVLQDAKTTIGIAPLIGQVSAPQVVTLFSDVWPPTIELTLVFQCGTNQSLVIYPVGIRLATGVSHMGKVSYAVIPIEPDAGM